MAKRLRPVVSRISFSASMEVQAGMPVSALMVSHSRSSASKPSQPAEVPFQPITSSLASASSRAASRKGASSNWPSACGFSEISVTRKRPKWAVTSGSPASMALVTGSSTVFDEGVSIPISVRFCKRGSP